MFNHKSWLLSYLDLDLNGLHNIEVYLGLFLVVDCPFQYIEGCERNYIFQINPSELIGSIFSYFTVFLTKIQKTQDGIQSKNT